MANAESTNTPRIALLGPVTPYRGGIAQYTTALRAALDKHAKLTTISFKRQYPMWLYPGETDKDPTRQDQTLEGVSYLLDIYNPLSWRKAADKIANEGCEIAVMTWWTIVWQPGFAYIARRLRRRGVKVVFLCHNLFDHGAKGAKRKISETLLKQADAYIVHGTEQAKLLHDIAPDTAVMQRLHPIYTHFPDPSEQLPKRGKLELLFFGLVRPYKGLDVLIEALAKLNNSDIHLTVAGEPWGDKVEQRAKLEQAGVPNLELHLNYITDEDAANYFARADAVILPYLSATGSGVVPLAYHYGKPVVATRVGGLPDTIIEGKTGWLVAPKDSAALVNVISTLDRQQLQGMQKDIATFCEKNSWDAFAHAICEFVPKLKD